MKKMFIAIVSAVMLAGTAFAGPHGGHGGPKPYYGPHQSYGHHHRVHGGYGAPAAALILGGIVGYAIANSNQPQVVVQQPAPPVYVVPAPPTYIPPPPGPVYQKVYEYDPRCGCYMWIVRQVGWQ